MRRLILLALVLPLLGAADPVVVPGEPSLAQAQAEVTRTAAEEVRLTAAASSAGNEAERLAGERRAAAAAITVAEARIGAAEIIYRSAQADMATRKGRLAQQQAPVAGLLAGLVTMGRRPPLLALADGSTEEFVRVRALLDATMPAIRARTAALSADLFAGQRAAASAAQARDRLAKERTGLEARRTQFAALEQRALSRQTSLAGQALGAGDETLAGGEMLGALGNEASRRRNAMNSATELARLDPIPGRPGSVAALPPLLAYQLPLDAPVAAGLGTVDTNGIRSRGLSLRNGRGAALVVPADGTVVFAGPYRRSDGVIIIDHGGGWISLIVNVATSLPKGATVRRGDPLGRALGPVEIDLTHDGAAISPAFIAASSAMLSNRVKGG
ncbi:murein hydrolase activator EnvC family protein [Sphingomonas sp. RB1R13]|uniref:murein hydrolase activator EnvC family protein n=1 Tax=Sphingomonas sp. RB1R13 TaxID=3096159 RepID=UPI002FC9DFE9